MTVTYREALLQLRDQGYLLVRTNADDHEITDHINEMDGDGPEVTIQPGTDVDGPGAVRIIRIDPDGHHDTGKPWAIAYREELTSVQAAEMLGVHRDTTRRAAADGLVQGARQDPRPGTINPPWVATETAWRQWYESRRSAGRPSREERMRIEEHRWNALLESSTPAEAWSGFVGSQTPSDFWEGSQDRGIATVEQAAGRYAEEMPSMADEWANLTAEHRRRIADLLASYLHQHLG